MTIDENAFTRRGARRPTPAVADPLLQWATGLNTSDRRIQVGWMTEAGKSDELDAAASEADMELVTIKHGSGNTVPYWVSETLHLYIVAEGVQSIAEMQQTPERFGIAFGWETVEGRTASRLRARVFVQELLEVGYTQPLTLTLKGTITGDFLAALMTQYDVLDEIDAIRQADGKPPMEPPFYACAIPLGPGQEVTRGKGNNTKAITPMASLVPHPVTREHILASWAKRPTAALIERIYDATLAWSVAESAAIASGRSEAEEAGDEPEERPARPSAPQAAPQAPSYRARFFARYAEVVGGDTWQHVCNYIGKKPTQPADTDLNGWKSIAEDIATTKQQRDAATALRTSGKALSEWDDIAETERQLAARRR